MLQSTAHVTGRGAIAMTRKRSGSRPAAATAPAMKQSATSSAAAFVGSPLAASVQPWPAYAAIIAMLGAALIVDPWAEAAFDAPKWLIVRLAAVIAVCALLYAAQPSASGWLSRSLRARVAVYLIAFAGGCALLATLRSVHGFVAWNALLAMALGGLWLFVGASRVFDGVLGRRVFLGFLVATGVNAIVSIMQIAGITLPLDVASLGGRYASGALLGNEGYVALACAMMGASAIALLCADKVSSRARLLALAALVLAVAGIALNRQVTSAAALIVAATVIVAARIGRRWIVGTLAVAIALLFASAAVPGLRSHTWGNVVADDVATYQQLTTYRLGAWIAALQMIESSPWIGHGPGAYAQESTARRLEAEPHFRARFVQPVGATFVSAHQEPLQGAAELGVPAAAAIIAAFAIVFFGLLATRQCNVVDPERLVLLGLLGVGAVSALAWFPLQIPLTAVALLIGCGRAWRLCAERIGDEHGE
jgi:O-antigen ligase